jgi:beta-fructofuranosidase
MILRRDFVAGLFGTVAFTAMSRKLRAGPLSDDDSTNLLAHRLANDPLRPQYHLLPAANWMNDPNGPIFWNGNYHMFYQYNPGGAEWGAMHWGHAISPDMIHWRHLPVALAPTPGGPDADGCFTGTAVVKDGQVVVLYTGVRSVPREQATIKDGNPPMLETQCLASSSDSELRNWTKLPEPVLSTPPQGIEVNGFRDPSPWHQGDWWYMAVASGIANRGGAVLLYRSKDLRAWEFLHVLSRRDASGTNGLDPFDPWEVWECPEFFPLGDWHVLIFSTAGKTYWQSGKLDEEQMIFHPQQAGILDYGSYYAAKTQLDKAGNRIVWGWITEARPLEAYKAAGWAGVMSLPRVLSAAADGRLRFRVAEVASRLRIGLQTLNLTADEDQNIRQLRSMRIEGCCGEILCTARRSAEPFALSLRGSSQQPAPWLKIGFDPLHPREILIDDRPIPMDLRENENLEFHFYVDGSVIEAFVNQQIACTRRFYYTGGKPQDLCMKWSGKSSSLVSLSVSQLSPISADRLTT